MEPDEKIDENNSSEEESPAVRGNDADQNVEQATAPNPDGFFPELTDSNACSVNVAVRVRPLIGRELTEGTRKCCIAKPGAGMDADRIQIGTKSFIFDKVFWDDVDQEYIFDTCTRNLVLGCFHGFNATILAYGQTGSGKTHSMGTGSTLGLPFEQVGIVPRVFKFIFDELELRRAQSEYSEFKVKISFLELYNEELHDLLDPMSMQRDKITGKPLKEMSIREEKNGVISIRGLKETEVTTQEQCLHHLNMGINHRITSSTGMNATSSRSHAVFTVAIEQKIIKEIEDGEEKKEGDEKATSTEEISSKFHFVDLAGSERIKKTGAQGQQLKEGISINKGLLCLGQVIKALTEGKRDQAFIPYRDSKLTRILQDSLGGNSRTTMIACVSPAEFNYEETLSTIRYASSARNIKNKPVVNRDANSMLIESLRSQIQHLQLEMKEYCLLLQESGVKIPSDLNARVLDRQKTQQEAVQRRQSVVAPSNLGGGGANPQEVKELKIKLSHKEKEIRELTQKLRDNQVYLDQKDKQLKELTSENDCLNLKCEAMEAKLKENSIEFDAKSFEPKPAADKDAAAGAVSSLIPKGGLVDQYKTKLAKVQKELEQKLRELSEKDQKMMQVKQAADRSDRMLKKHMGENESLKKQLQNLSSGAALPQRASAIPTTIKASDSEPVVKRDLKAMRASRKEQKANLVEEFQTKLFDNLQNQLDEMWSKKVTSINKEPGEEEDAEKKEDEEEKKEEEPKEGEPKEEPVKEEANAEVDEKAKLLEDVRKQYVNMSSDIKDLLKNEWAGMITNLEGEKAKAELQRKDNLLKSKGDSQATQQIEKDHKSKMDALNAQVNKLEREKQKKEESVAKQVAVQETRIKALEADLQRMRKKKEEIENAKKFDEKRFFTFKQSAAKDLTDAKKNTQEEKKKQAEKERKITQMKQEYKKVDSLAQQAIAQLKGMQKRAAEERQRRSELEQKEANAKGIDMDLIKEWITYNTDAMLKQEELREYQQKQVDQKEKIETEMLEEGDRLTEVLVQQEKLSFEKEDLENAPEDQRDEGRIFEIEDSLKDLALEVQSITQSLEDQQETLEFVQSKLNQATEEMEGFDMDSVAPMEFSALESIDSARATLKTFFSVVLDLNIYKRDLERKCIDQDEVVIGLENEKRVLEARLKFMMENGGVDGYADSQAKKAAISNMMDNVEDFVDNRDMANLNLNKDEAASFTKLNLSKIVNNLRKKLSDQEQKNQRIALKLDQALKQKDIFKLKAEEAKKLQAAGSAPASRPPVQSKVQSRLMDSQNTKSSPFSAGGRARGNSFKERQQQKKEQASAKPITSLADRRRDKSSLLEDTDQMGGALDHLKQSAEGLLANRRGPNDLDAIAEDDEVDDEPVSDKKEGRGLTVIYEESADAKEESKRIDGVQSLVEPSSGNPLQPADENEMSPSKDLEPDSNFPHSVFIDEKKNLDDSGETNELWVQETLFTLDATTTSKLIDFVMLNTCIFCVFEDCSVKQIGIVSKKIEKTFSLTEVEDFELDLESQVRAFTLEKDVQLMSIAFDDCVHVFEFDEEAGEEETGLSYITKLEFGKVKKMIFAEYHLILVQEEGANVTLGCADLDSASVETAEVIVKPTEDCKIFVKSGTDATENVCIYYATGQQIGKIEVPAMTSVFKVDSGHSRNIMAMSVANQYGQIITASQDETVRFFSCMSGKPCYEALEGMDNCDFVNALGANLVMRVGQGEERAVLLWKLREAGGVDEEELNEIELNDEDRKMHDEASTFEIKSGLVAGADKGDVDIDKEQHLLLFITPQSIVFRQLKQNQVKY